MNPRDADFIAQFESQRWPLDQWHHSSHVRLAYLCLTTHPFEQAAERVRNGIRRYNAAHGITDTPTTGYHETMTVAWLRLVEMVLQEYGEAEDAQGFLEAHPELLQKEALRLFYSRNCMMSPEAKRSFVEPDLTPLPRPRRGRS